MTEVYWTARAREDLTQIYLAAADERTGKALMKKLQARVEGLQTLPRMGSRRDDIRKGMRMIVERPYLIFYRVNVKGPEETIDRVDIVRVIDGRRDLNALL